MLRNVLEMHFSCDQVGRTKPHFPYLIIVLLIADSRITGILWNQIPTNSGRLLYFIHLHYHIPWGCCAAPPDVPPHP